MRWLLSTSVLSLVLVGCRDLPGPESPAPPSTALMPAQRATIRPRQQVDTILEARRFERRPGRPATETVEFLVPFFEDHEQPYVLRLRNGDEAGRHRVPSAVVRLNGARVFRQRDFAGRVGELHADVPLVSPSVLSVTLFGGGDHGRQCDDPSGRDGDERRGDTEVDDHDEETCVAFLTIWIEGTLTPGVARMGPAGGVLAAPAGSAVDGADLFVPPGAFEQSQIIRMSVGSQAQFQQALSQAALGGSLAGPVVAIQSTDQTLARPARLTLRYDPARLPEGSGARALVVVSRSDSGEVSVLGGSPDAEAPVLDVDEARASVSVSVDHFSEFAPVALGSVLGRVKRVGNVGCSSGAGRLDALIIDDQDLIGPIQPLRTFGLPARTSSVNLIVIHSTDSPPMQTIDQVIQYGYANQCGPCQAHYYVDRDGTVYRFVAEDFVAFHAGAANGASIGIELLQHVDRQTGQVADVPPFTDAQYGSLTSLLRGLLERYPNASTTFHSVLDPGRKLDPRAFDAARIADPSTCPSVAPPTPVVLTQLWPVFSTGSYIGLFWTRNTDADFAEYTVFRSVTPNVTTSDQLVATLTNQSQVYFRDGNLGPGTYFYRVFAFNQAGVSSPSNEISGRVFAPTELIFRIPGVPDPDDTSFPPDVAIPSFLAPVNIGDCPRDPVDPFGACLGPHFTIGPLVDQFGHVGRLRIFNGVVLNNLQMNGVSNFQFNVHHGDLVDVRITAQDQDYQLSVPFMGLSAFIPQGQTRSVSFGSNPIGTTAIVVQAGAQINPSVGTINVLP